MLDIGNINVMQYDVIHYSGFPKTAILDQIFSITGICLEPSLMISTSRVLSSGHNASDPCYWICLMQSLASPKDLDLESQMHLEAMTAMTDRSLDRRPPQSKLIILICLHSQLLQSAFVCSCFLTLEPAQCRSSYYPLL
jgi:hypothetical protein